MGIFDGTKVSRTTCSNLKAGVWLIVLAINIPAIYIVVNVYI